MQGHSAGAASGIPNVMSAQNLPKGQGIGTKMATLNR